MDISAGKRPSGGTIGGDIMKHNELASRVMKMLLSGDEEVLLILREQYERANIIFEEDSGVGFYIRYQADNAIRIGDGVNNTFQIGDVDGEIDGINGAVGFVVFIKDGYLTMLEGYTNSIDKWPETDAEIKLFYNTEQRDYVSLRKTWTKVNDDVF